eukprot:12736010-Alexandrium_andersonii.AAC.1
MFGSRCECASARPHTELAINHSASGNTWAWYGGAETLASCRLGLPQHMSSTPSVPSDALTRRSMEA